MNTKLTDVIIHTGKPLTQDQLDAIESQARSVEGLISFNRNKKMPAFIMVAYNAGQTRSTAILDKITRHG